MKLQFRVHNPHRVPVAQTVDFRGAPVRAAIDAFEVELMSTDGVSGTLKLRLLGEDVAKGEALFKNDAIISADLAAA